MAAQQQVEDASWRYLNTHETLKRIDTEDILEIYPETFKGGYATVQRANLRKEEGSQKLVALKTLNYALDNKTKEGRLNFVKVSPSITCKIYSRDPELSSVFCERTATHSQDFSRECR